jgi:hypothetical protein
VIIIVGSMFTIAHIIIREIVFLHLRYNLILLLLIAMADD